MLFWWICGGESVLPVLLLRHLGSSPLTRHFSTKEISVGKEDNLKGKHILEIFFLIAKFQKKITIISCTGWKWIKLFLFVHLDIIGDFYYRSPKLLYIPAGGLYIYTLELIWSCITFFGQWSMSIWPLYEPYFPFVEVIGMLISLAWE